jgi:hypothetical protein
MLTRILIHCGICAVIGKRLYSADTERGYVRLKQEGIIKKGFTVD